MTIWIYRENLRAVRANLKIKRKNELDILRKQYLEYVNYEF